MPVARVAPFLLVCGLLTGCQTAMPSPQILLERSGVAATLLPPFTSRGTYDVAYSFDHCGRTPGLALIAHVRGVANPDTLLRTAVPGSSGDVTGDRAGIVSLEVDTSCKWKVTVKG